MPKPTYVSYSAISMWETCALQYKFAYVEGLDRPSGPAAARGTRLHKALEKYLKGQLPEEQLPVDFWRIKSTLVRYKEEFKAKSEDYWCALENWKKCSKDHPKVWVKAVLDVRYRIGKTLYIVDLKTGRIYPEHVDQLQIYATLALSRMIDIDKVIVKGLYADEGKEWHEATYPRAMANHLRNYWRDRGNKVLTDEVYMANPKPENCKYCPFNKAKGGPCLHGA